MLNKEQVYKIIDFVLSEAKGYNTRVLVRGSAEGLTRFANSEIHQNMFDDNVAVNITVVSGKKQSEIETTTYDNAGLKAAVQEAINNLQFLPEGEFEVPFTTSPELIETEDFNSALEKAFNTMERAKMIKEGIALLAEGYKAFGALSYQISQLAYGNSTGVKRYALGNTVEFSVLISSETGGSGYAELISDRPEDLDIVGAFKIAYDKARMNQNPQEIEPGAYTVILEPLAVGEMLTYMSYVGFSGKSVQNRYSFLTSKKGEKIFDERINIVDDYTDPNTMNMPFDLEGFPRKKVTIIDKGVARDLVYDSVSAIRAGVETTGHSINEPQQGGFALNLVMANGDESLQELIKNTKKGLLITRFHYMNVVTPRQCILTALTRDGVFTIENGEITGAVKNMRFTESVLEAFNNIAGISKERHRVKSFYGNFYVPVLKIDNFHFTGKTNA